MRHRNVLASGILLVLSLSASVVPAQPATPKADDELRAHFLDIGAGSCQVIECPGTPATTHPLIVDCGSVAKSQALAKDKTTVQQYVSAVLSPYPNPIVIVSHADKDHSRFLPDLVPAGKAKTIWFGGQRSGYSTTVKKWFDDQDNKTPLFRRVVRRQKRLTENSLRAHDLCRMVKRRLKEAGLPSRLSPHSFRVATITDLLEQGVPLEDVQQLVGHADPRTTRLYDRRQRRITRNIVERISI